MLEINKVKNYFHFIRAQYPEITDDMLDEEGKIYYMNGNDGTDFDWGCNDRLCEFYVFFREDGDKNGNGFIKVFVNKNDTMTAYVYADGGMHPTDKPVPVQLDDGDAARLAAQMLFIADNRDIFDRPIDELDFDAPIPFYITDSFLHGYEDDEDDYEEGGDDDD